MFSDLVYMDHLMSKESQKFLRGVSCFVYSENEWIDGDTSELLWQ